jgi:hypothetical protein
MNHCFINFIEEIIYFIDANDFNNKRYKKIFY